MKLPRLKHFKLNKTWLLLGVALAIGLLAALAARNYLAGQMAAIEARAKQGQIAVVVATRPLKAGEKLGTDNAAIRSMPADFAHSSIIRPEEFPAYEGRALQQALQRGDAVLKTMLSGQAPATFSARVGSGRRAITVPVDEISSISGMVEPGDVVDLMLSMENSGKKLTFPLLQGVSVMATGQRAVDDPQSGERRQYSTVTLDTTPEQAQHLILAREAGKLTALLRNPQDKQALAGTEAGLAYLLGTGGQPVPVLYGGRNARLAPDALVLKAFARPPAGATASPTGIAIQAQAASNGNAGASMRATAP